MKDLYSILSKCSTEEEVKYEFAKFFRFKLDTKERIDLYTESILFEFKYDVNLKSVHARSRVIAQSLYYIRRLKYGSDSRAPSRWICAVDKNEAVIVEATDLKKYYYSSMNASKYDWDLRPSYPDSKLVNDLSRDDIILKLFVYDFSDKESLDEFIKKINFYKTGEQISIFDDKKEITEDNFYPIYLYWNDLFGEYVENGRKSSEYFITDIEHGRSCIVENTQLLFRMNSGETVTKYIPMPKYQHFWNIYSRIMDYRVINSIRQKMDRMTEIEQRRFTGEFFTPLTFAEKALDYIYRVVGKKCWESGKFRLWDMAAGTGNLEFILPAEAIKYSYISTLLDDDAEYCKKLYPDATVFQYDYLNDDIPYIQNPDLRALGLNCKMPYNLIEDLSNPELTWIIFINPPYVTSNNLERQNDDVVKDKVSMTKIQKIMTDEDMGETSRELCSQFLYRISREFKGKNAYISMFSKIKYINSTNDQKLRDNFFKYTYERGFIFSSKNFDGCKQEFPIGFMIWNMSAQRELENQEIIADVYDSNVEKIGIKQIKADSRDAFLSKWIKREKNNEIRPPLSSAITVADKNKDRRDKVAKGFLASFMCKGNDYANQNYTSFLSSPYVSAGALSVTPNNFEMSMIVSVVRRLPKATWLNDRDQMMQPVSDVLSNEKFVSDCVIWALFSSFNDTVSLEKVKYEGKTYRVVNEFYPFLLEDIRKWNYDNSDIKADAFARHEDRFVAKWINTHSLTTEGKAVLSAAEKIYRYFYLHINEIPWPKYKIKKWDAGWWQIRMSLTEAGLAIDEIAVLKEAHKQLGQKLLPQIYNYEFISPDMKQIE